MGQRFHFVEELVLAVVTAASVVGDVERICEFGGVNAFVANSVGLGEFAGFTAVVLRETGRQRGYGQGSLAKSFASGPGEIRRISAAGISYQE